VASNPHKTAAGARRLLSIRSVADELAVSTDTLDRVVRRGDIPIVRLPSGRRRVAREDLDRVIEDWKSAGR
jgi:excisionase family DNA binding protein